MFTEPEEIATLDVQIREAEAALASLKVILAPQSTNTPAAQALATLANFIAQQREICDQAQRILHERTARWERAYEETRGCTVDQLIATGYISQAYYDAHPDAEIHELMGKNVQLIDDTARHNALVNPKPPQTIEETHQPSLPPPQPAQTKSELPKLLLIKRCGALFLYQDMDGKLIAKRELLPQTYGTKPVPESVSELNPLHFIVEYGTEGATKILERYTLEQLQTSCRSHRLENPKEIQNLSKEKLINLIVRRCVKRLNQDLVFIING